MQEKKKPQREYNKDYLSKINCYKCGKQEHLSRNCYEPMKNPNNSSRSKNNSNEHVTVNKETLQPLISIIDNNKTSEERKDQQTFVSLVGEHERRRPITTLSYKKNKKDTNVISDPNIVPEQGSMEGPVD
ncbi:18965_t:CDS:2, partial [Gigaspora rosea]